MDTAVGSLELLRSFRLALTADGLKPPSVGNYLRDVERFAAHVGGRSFDAATPDDFRSFVTSLRQRRAAKTVHEAQLGIRRFFKFLVREGEIASDPTREIGLVRYRVDPQPTYSDEEVKGLLSVCRVSTLSGVRDRAMVMLLFDTGGRAGELISMGLPDWQQSCVVVDGKTGVRRVPLGSASLQAVDRYVRRRRIREGVLWRGKKGPLTVSGVHQLIGRLCRRAGVEDKGVHAFRRAAAAQMKRLGMNDSDILEVMGWKDITMLRRYTAAVASELAQAAHRRFSPADALRH